MRIFIHNPQHDLREWGHFPANSTMVRNQWDAVTWCLSLTQAPLYRQDDPRPELRLGGNGFVLVGGSDEQRAAFYESVEAEIDALRPTGGK